MFNSNSVLSAHVDIKTPSVFERPVAVFTLEARRRQVLEQVSDDEFARRSRFAGGTLDDTLWVLRQVLDKSE